MGVEMAGYIIAEVQVTDLDLNVTLNTLTAGTYGRSAFQALRT